MVRATLKHLSPAVAFVAAILASAPPCSAQGQVDVTPVVGLYMGSDLFKVNYGDFGSGVEAQNDALVLGARVTAWASKRLAVEFSYGHWRSDLSNSASGSVTTASLGLLVTLTSRDSASFFISGGLSSIKLGGAAYGGLFAVAPAQTNWGALVGVGGRVTFSPALALRVEVEDHLYTLTGLASTSSHEHALVFSLGLSVALRYSTDPPR
jgi:hypothetical protein